MPDVCPSPAVKEESPSLAVLDTQVVLDWLVFRDPGTALLARSLEAGSVRWLTVPAMREELDHVVACGVAAAWHPNRGCIAQTFARLAQEVQARPAPGRPLRCSDPDDQMFIDLALAASAQWLFTRDRALLRLAGRARERGVTVIRPADWQASLAPAG